MKRRILSNSTCLPVDRMKVPSTINGKLWAPAKVRDNQRPMAPLVLSMTSLQHFTIFFFKRQLVQAFQKITKRPQTATTTTPTNKHVHFSLVFCLVFLVFLVGAWWGTCVFCLRVKGHPFPPSLCSGSETHPDARNVQCAGQQ